MNRPYIGILVDGLIYGGIKHGHSYFEDLSLYEEAGKQYDLIPCYFRLKDITPGSDRVNAFVRDADGEYSIQDISFPLIIHNRGLFFTKSADEKTKNLKKDGIFVFNEWNR